MLLTRFSLSIRLLTFSLSFVTGFSQSATGQALPSYISISNGQGSSTAFKGMAQVMAPVSSPTLTMELPFSAEEHRSLLKDGADPSAAVEFPARKIYRDAEGRTRLERAVIETPEGMQSPRIVEILDPYDGSYFVLDPNSKTAYRIVMPKRPRPATAEADADVDRKSLEDLLLPPEDTVELNVKGTLLTPGQRPGRSSMKNAAPMVGTTDLGIDLINGIEAYGERITMTAAGPIGNDGVPPLRTTDTWYSNRLKVRVFQMVTDPFEGTTTTQLSAFSPTDPAPALFAVPAGYTVQEVPTGYTIRFGNQ